MYYFLVISETLFLYANCTSYKRVEYDVVFTI